jgi:hypothetical protein
VTTSSGTESAHAEYSPVIVSVPRTAGGQAHADVARLGPAVALGHVHRALDVPTEVVGDRSALAQRGVERVDGRARHTEGAAHTLALQDEDRGVGSRA